MTPLIPGFNPMQMQPMEPMQRQQGGPSEMGLKIMQAALNQQNRGAPQAPQGGMQPGAPTNLAPPVNPMQMGVGLLAKLLGRGAPPAAPTLPDQGGPGPAPNALTGVW